MKKNKSRVYKYNLQPGLNDIQARIATVCGVALDPQKRVVVYALVNDGLPEIQLEIQVVMTGEAFDAGPNGLGADYIGTLEFEPGLMAHAFLINKVL